MAEATEQLLGAATFICGHPKSGTSLLAGLLDGHPQLVVYPEESGYFRRVYDQLEAADVDAPAMMETQVLHIFHWNPRDPHPTQANFPGRDYSNVPFEQVRAAFHRILDAQGVSARTLLPAAMLAFGEVAGLLSEEIQRWVEKTPYNEYFAEEIFALWPQARCLHVVRDPRDNYASYRRKHPDWRPEVFALSWRASLQRGLRNRRTFGAERYLILRYEDLVLNVDETVELVRRFLGIEDDPALRRPTRLGRPWQGNSMFGEAFDGVSASPVGRYRRHLSPGEVARLEAALGQEMARWGYRLTGSPVRGLYVRWLAFRLRWWLRWSLGALLPRRQQGPRPVWMR